MEKEKQRVKSSDAECEPPFCESSPYARSTERKNTTVRAALHGRPFAFIGATYAVEEDANGAVTPYTPIVAED